MHTTNTVLQTTPKPIPLPCEVLEVEIGQLEQEILRAGSHAQKAQLLKIMATVQKTYKESCGSGTEQLAGANIRMNFINGAVLMTMAEERGSGVRVIMAGADGVLVTIDGNGQMIVRPPDGPGDREIRQAVAAMAQAVKVLGSSGGFSLSPQVN